jgi:hypothetical protein
MNDKSWIVNVQETEDGELFIQFTDEMLEGTGFKVGDTVEWIDNGNGSWSIKKKETQWVLVEAIGQFRHRYLVEVPHGKAEWAMDTVVMNEAKEFSQEYLGEVIVSHRVIEVDKALELCDNDNSYGKGWDTDSKMKNFFTFMSDYYDYED